MSFVSDIRNKGIERAKQKVAETTKTTQSNTSSSTTNQAQSVTTAEEQPQTSKKKWVLPVVISVGAILLGVVTYFVLKPKNKK